GAIRLDARSSRPYLFSSTAVQNLFRFDPDNFSPTSGGTELSQYATRLVGIGELSVQLERAFQRRDRVFLPSQPVVRHAQVIVDRRDPGAQLGRLSEDRLGLRVLFARVVHESD